MLVGFTGNENPAGTIKLYRKAGCIWVDLRKSVDLSFVKQRVVPQAMSVSRLEIG